MPLLAFLIFEVSVYLLGLLCLRHAWQRGRRFVSELMAGMAYGVVLEYATIQSFHSYTYGDTPQPLKWRGFLGKPAY